MVNPGFRLAKAQFDKVTGDIKQPERNPELWNLSIGLSQLAEALERELEALNQKVSAIDSDVKSMR
jgi:hypothetical protein